MKRFLFGIAAILVLNAADYTIPPDTVSFYIPSLWVKSANKLKGTLCQYVEQGQNQTGFNNNMVVTVMEVTENEAQKISEIGVSDTNIKTQERTFPLYKVLEKTQRDRGGPRDLNIFLSGNPVYWG